MYKVQHGDARNFIKGLIALFHYMVVTINGSIVTSEVYDINESLVDSFVYDSAKSSNLYLTQ